MLLLTYLVYHSINFNNDKLILRGVDVCEGEKCHCDCDALSGYKVATIVLGVLLGIEVLCSMCMCACRLLFGVKRDDNNTP
jgi:hypothetical protein